MVWEWGLRIQYTLARRYRQPGDTPCHSGERSDVGIRGVYAANLREMCNACALETDRHTSLRIGSQ